MSLSSFTPTIDKPTIKTVPVLSAGRWYERAERLGVSQDDLGLMNAQGWVSFNSTESVINGELVKTFDMERKEFQAERCLNDLIASHTKALNEARALNNDRYGDILQLFKDLLTNTHSYISELETSYSSTNTAVNELYDAYATDVDGNLDAYGEAQRLRINNQFDALQAAEAQNLINRGMYNSVVAASVSATIEEKRAQALTEFEDSLIRLKLGRADVVYDKGADLKQRMYDLMRASYTPFLQLRNDIVVAMANFAERRNDEAPAMESISELAAQLSNSLSTGTVEATAPTSGSWA